MSRKYVRLLNALHTLPDRPADLHAFLAAAPSVGARPSPYLLWPLLGLVEYRGRKQWAWQTVKERLPRKVLWPRKGPGPSPRIVPGLPDWEFSVECDYVDLTHRGTREVINVNLTDGPDLIPDYEFTHYYQTHREPGPAARRLAHLFPWSDNFYLPLRALMYRGMLRYPKESDNVRICRRVMRHADAIAHFLTRWEDTDERLWLAAWVGDWLAAHEAAQAAGRADLIPLTAPRAEACRQRWLDWLRHLLARHGLYDALLDEFANAGAEDLPGLLHEALSGESATLWPALEIIAEDPSWCARVYRQLIGAKYADWDTEEEMAALYLGRHGHRVPEVIAYLLRYRSPRWKVLIELALGNSPERLRKFARRGCAPGSGRTASPPRPPSACWTTAGAGRNCSPCCAGPVARIGRLRRAPPCA